MRSLTIAASVFAIVSACASRSQAPDRAAAPRAASPRTLTWRPGSHGGEGTFSIDLRTCTMVRERAGRMPRSGPLDAARCASLAEAARVRPPPVEKPAEHQGVLSAVIPESVEIAYDDDHRVAAAEDLRAMVTRLVATYSSALEATGATPPGECDFIECRPEQAGYVFSEDEERCVRDESGACVIRRKKTH